MTKRYFLTAAAGCWLASVVADAAIKREFVPSIETNDESAWEEVTDEYKTAYETQWASDHPEEVPSDQEPSDQVPSDEE